MSLLQTIKFLRRHLWVAFLAHQLLILGIAILFLNLVRRLTGRTIRGGRDPIGFLDGAVLVALSVGIIVLTRVVYHWVKGRKVHPLGLAMSMRRFIELMAGLVIGFGLFIFPYLHALWRGTAFIHDRIGAHVGSLTAVRLVSVAMLMLLLASVMEETANRAFPMRLWEHRSLLFRVVVPSIFFAALHFGGEPFAFDRAGILVMAGIVHSLAYALTGNIWLTSGLHAGANIASFSMSGLWHAGAIVSVFGRPSFPNWVAGLALMALLGTLLALSRKKKPDVRRREEPPGAAQT